MSDMKRFLFLFLTVLPLAVWAQGECVSLLDEDIVWEMRSKGVLPSEYGDYYTYEEFRLQGDTVINDIPFKKMYVKRWNTGGQKPSNWSFDRYYLGQDGSKVFLYVYNVDNPEIMGITKLIMDFSVADGDYFPVEDNPVGQWGYSVQAVKDTLLNCFPDKEGRRCLFLKATVEGRNDNSGDVVDDIWMEGIGSYKYGITGRMGQVGSFPQLMKCTKGDVVLFEYQEPSATNISQPVLQDKVTGSDIFDLQGRRLKAKPSRGIYMERGKKYLTK
jgi:hypothetical protein